MKKPQIVHQPYYPGGQEAMQAYLQANLSYPVEALAAGVEGTVQLRYDINHRGEVVGTELLSGIGHGCDEEAIRLVRGMQFALPKKARGIRIRYHKTIKVNFHLPKAKGQKSPPPTPAPPATEPITSLNYTVTTTQAPDAPAKESYSYQISLPNQD